MTPMQIRFLNPLGVLFIYLTICVSCKKSEISASGQGSASSPVSSQAPGASPTESEARAKELVSGFLKSETEQLDLTRKLIPTFEQCKTAFVPEEMAVKICEPWKEAPRAPNARLSPNGEQTEVLVSSATTEDLRAWNQKGQSFPPGYKRLAEYLRPGITVYRFTFVEPGKTAGLAFDALFFLDGKWFFVPKPWRGLRRGVREAEGK